MSYYKSSSFCLSCFCNKQLHKNADKLTLERMKVFDFKINKVKKRKDNYESNYRGSMGEEAFVYIMSKNGINCKKLYDNFYKNFIGDVVINDIHIEIKTRMSKDFNMYGNETLYKQYETYKESGKQVFYCWMVYDPKYNKAVLRGWNKIDDFNKKFRCSINEADCVKSDIIRDANSLISFFKKHTRIPLKIKKQKE